MREMRMYDLELDGAGFIRAVISWDSAEIPTISIPGRFGDEFTDSLEALEDTLDSDFIVKVFNDKIEARKAGMVFQQEGVEYPLGFLSVNDADRFLKQQSEVYELRSKYDRANTVLWNMLYADEKSGHRKL